MSLFNILVNRLNHTSHSNLVNQFNHTSRLNPIDSITSHYEKWIDSIKSNQNTAESNQSIQSTWLVYNPGYEQQGSRNDGETAKELWTMSLCPFVFLYSTKSAFARTRPFFRFQEQVFRQPVVWSSPPLAFSALFPRL